MEMNGKRKKEEPEDTNPENTITLPNGQVIKVSGNGNPQFQPSDQKDSKEQLRSGQRKGPGNGERSKPATGQ